MKKEKAIRFNSEMVRDILDGRKTQIRRPIKEMHHPKGFMSSEDYHEYIKGPARTAKEAKYQPGDILYVQEPYSIVPDDDEPSGCSAVLYAASGQQYGSIRSAISMRKEYSRIWLEVTNVRVERLQDISEEDAKAEGIEWKWDDWEALERGEQIPVYKDYLTDEFLKSSERESFQSLWDSIYGTWDKNLWVFVYEFKVLSTTGKPNINGE